MYLLNPNDMQQTMLARDIEDTFSLILQADLQITQWMIRMLNTQLGEEDREDCFYCDQNRLGDQTPYYMLMLARGFLKKDVPIQITMVDDYRHWENALPVDPLTVKVDYDKGYVTVVDYFPTGRYIKVCYSAGYATKDVPVVSLPNQTFPVYDGVPAWLTSIATTGAIEIYKGLKLWERAPDKVKVKQKVSLTVTRSLDIEEMLVPYLRFAPYALKTIDS